MDYKFLKEIGKSAGALFLAALAVIYTAFHLFGMGENKLDTTFITESEARKTISITGYFFRDESTIETGKNGVVSPIVSDGEKVTAGDNVARLYSGASEEELAAIAALDAGISALTNARNLVSTMSREAVSAAVSALLNRIVGDASFGRFPTGIGNAEIGILTLIAQGKIITGEIMDTEFVSLLEALRAERNRRAGAVEVTNIKSDSGGNYFETSDGMENIFKYSNIDKMTPAEFSDAINAFEGAVTPPASAGKLTDNFYWYFAAFTSEREGSAMKVGREYTLIISGKEVKSTLFRSVADHSTGRTMLIFGTNATMEQAYVNARSAVARVVSVSVSGYKIPNSALRVLDGETGVFTVGGNLIYFREIVIIEEIDNFVIASTTAEDNELKNGDLVVLGGKKLHDKKIIR